MTFQTYSERVLQQTCNSGVNLRRCLRRSVLVHMETFGSRGADSKGFPTIDDECVKLVVGAQQSMTVGDLMDRMEQNNKELSSGRTAQLLAIANMHGWVNLTDGERGETFVLGVVTAISYVIPNFRKTYSDTSQVTTKILEDVLNTVCICMHVMGMFADKNLIDKVIAICGYYLSDVLWFASTKHHSKQKYGVKQQKEQDGGSPSSCWVATAYLSIIDGPRRPNKSKLSLQRWYAEPLSALVAFLDKLAISIKMCRDSNIPVAREVFPQQYRVGYSGRWMPNSKVRENADGIHAQYDGFGVHNMHPSHLCSDTEDLSISQIISLPIKSIDCHSKSRATRDCDRSYSLSVELCKAMSINRYRLHRMHLSKVNGLNKVNRCSNYDSACRRFMQFCWVSIRRPANQSREDVISMSTVVSEYISSHQPFTREQDAGLLLQHISTLERWRCDLEDELKGEYECIQRQLQLVVESLVDSKFNSLYREISRKSSCLTTSRYLIYLQRMLLNQLSEIYDLTDSFFQPFASKQLDRAIKGLSDALDMSPLRAANVNKHKHPFFDFTCKSASEISSITSVDLGRLYSACTDDTLSLCFARCVDLKVVEPFLSTVSNMPIDAVRQPPTLEVSGFRRHACLFANQVNLPVAMQVHPLRTFDDTYEVLLYVQSFYYTPSVTNMLLYRFMDVFEELKLTTDASLPSKFELCTSIRSTASAWDVLDSRYGICKKVMDMTDFEYILYCIENIKYQGFSTEYMNRLTTHAPRRFYSQRQVQEHGSQPRVLHQRSTHPGNLTSQTYSDADGDSQLYSPRRPQQIGMEDIKLITSFSCIAPLSVGDTSSKIPETTGMDESRATTSIPDLPVGDTSPEVYPLHQHASKRKVEVMLAQSPEVSLDETEAGPHMISVTKRPRPSTTQWTIRRDEVKKLTTMVYNLIYKTSTDSRPCDLQQLLLICTRRDETYAPLLYAMVMSKIMLRRCTLLKMVDKSFLNYVSKGLSESEDLPVTQTWIKIALAVNLYKICMQDATYPESRWADVYTCIALMHLPNFTLQLISLHQLTMFQRSYMVGSIVNVEAMIHSAKVEFHLTKFSGVAFRFLDFVRVYAKPQSFQQKSLLVKMFQAILNLSVKVSTSAEVQEEDLYRSIYHHVVDIGMDEDITHEMLKVCTPYQHPKQDIFGRDLASLLTSTKQACEACEAFHRS